MRWFESSHPSQYAHMAELADALDLGSSVSRRGGSSPSMRTILSRMFSLMHFKRNVWRTRKENEPSGLFFCEINYKLE